MKRSSIAILVVLVVLALGARFIPGPRTIDDAYITFRYARNLLNGDGFVYNAGARVMGTTTPLYTFLMAGLGALSGGTGANFPCLALGVNAIADALTSILLWQLGSRLGSWRAGLAAGLVWTVAPFSVTFAIGGLETSVYVLLLTAVAYFYLRKQWFWTALLGGLALLTRVDALLLAVPLALDWLVKMLIKRERFPWLAAAAFIIPVAIWYGFAWVYFGSPFPHSVTAKLAAYRIEPGGSFIRLIQHYATPFMDNNLLGVVGIGIGLLAYPFLALVGTRAAAKQDPRVVPWLVYPWIYFLVFAISNPLLFRWYLTPPLPAYFFAIFFGLDQLIAALLKRVGSKGAVNTALGMVLLCAWPLTSVVSDWRLHPDHAADRSAPDMAYIQLEQIYLRAAELAAPHLTSDSVLAAGDVGVLGYFTPARILDTVGLNSPETTAYYPLSEDLYEINYAVAPDLILDQKPDMVILLEVYGRKGLFQDQRFLTQYRLLETLPTDMYGSRGMLIYERVH